MNHRRGSRRAAARRRPVTEPAPDPAPGAAEAALAAAIEDHRVGRLRRAEAGYRGILKSHPDQFDALNLLGVVMRQTGRHEAAVEHIGKAVALKPEFAEAHGNLGNALRELGRIDEAIAAFRRAISLKPGSAEAHYNLGIALISQSKFAEAASACREALGLKPEFVEAHNNLGNALKGDGKLDEAVAAYRSAIALKPDYALAHYNLGNALKDQGALGDAVAAYRKAIALKPGYAEAHGNLGNALKDQGVIDEAVAAYREAIALDPDFADAHGNLGAEYFRQGQFEESVAAFRKAATLRPDRAEAHANLGRALAAWESFDEAVAAYQRAIVLDPEHAEAHNDLGVARYGQGRIDEAIACYRRGIELQPNDPEPHNNLGKALRDQGKFEEAHSAFDHALAIDPTYDRARFGRAIICLLRGNFAAGWRDYRARSSTTSTSDKLHRDPLERKLAGKRVVVLKDQGLGDELFFLRFGPPLKARGVSIAYRSDSKIAGMVARIPFIDRLVGPDDDLSSYDLALSVGDLPHLLGMTDARGIPPSVEIPVLPDRLTEIRARLADLGPPPYIGVTWRAGPPGRDGLTKIAPLDRLAAALKPIDGTVVAMQRFPAAGEIDEFARVLGRAIHDLTALNDDLEGMLALTDLLDDYVCVCNTNFHLRAVRGRIGRVLVSNPPEFRWMASGEESPWFPGTSVYRQTADYDWEPAFAALERDLADAWPAS